MIAHRPPFAITTSTFRFRALALFAGKAALGGDREVALACFATARLAVAMLPPFLLSPADAAVRAVSTRHWLASMAVPGTARVALNAVVDAVAAGNRQVVSGAIAELARVAAGQLDQASAAEIAELARELSDEIGTG